MNMRAIMLAIAMVLSGCGGGGSSSSTPSAPDVEAETVAYSSRYSTDDLDIYFTISGTSNTDAKVNAYIQDSDYNYVTLNGTDKLLVSVDSMDVGLSLTQETEHSAGGEYYSAEVTSLASEYIVKFVRDNEIVSSMIATELPLPFTPTTSFSNEVIDISWAPEAGYSYYYLSEMLVCENSGETHVQSISPDVALGEHLLNSGSYTKTLADIFGKSQAQLTQGYDSCYFDIEVVATKDNLFSDSIGNLHLDINQVRIVKINLL